MGTGAARHRSQSVRLSPRAERTNHRDFRRARSHERGARLFRAAAVAPRQSATPESVGERSIGGESVGYSAERRNDEVTLFFVAFPLGGEGSAKTIRGGCPC